MLDHSFVNDALDELKDEIEDACKYLKESDDMEAQGLHYLAIGLHRIAMDEYSHANFLRDWLISKNAYYEHEGHKVIEDHWHRLRGRLGFES